ncbi:MAG: GAF domain-containing protein, partial [Candidatus Cloacimonadia bacterium]
MKKLTADRLNLSKKNSGLETFLLKECHRLLRTAENEASLLSRACRLFIELGNYSFAWVGLWNEKNNSLYPAAWAGFEKGFLSRVIKAYSI